MVRYKNMCVDCGLPCLGKACPYLNVPVYYCDRCGDEICGDVHFGTIAGHEYDELCEDCFEMTTEYDKMMEEEEE